MLNQILILLNQYAISLRNSEDNTRALLIYEFLINILKIKNNILEENYNLCVEFQRENIVNIHTNVFKFLGSINPSKVNLRENYIYDNIQEGSTLVKSLIESNSKTGNYNLTCEVEDIKIIIYKWPSSGEILFFPIYKNNIYLKTKIWLNFYPFLHKISDDFNYIHYNIKKNFKIIKIEQYFIFLENTHQFGHFLFDQIPKLCLLEDNKLPEKIPIITTKLLDYQREIIFSIFGNLNIIEYDVDHENLLIESKKAFVNIEMDVYSRVNFIRNKVKLIRNRIENSNTEYPKKIYITRNPNELLKRVLNSEELIVGLRNLGFSIIYGEERTFKEMINYCSCAEIMVCDPITPHLNFNAFSPDNCILIALLPDWLIEEPTTQFIESGMELLLPVINRTYFVGGYTEQEDKSHTAPCIYPLKSIIDLLKKFSNKN